MISLPLPGDPLPWFTAATRSMPDFRIHSVAGRIVVFCSPGDLRDPLRRAMLDRLRARRDVFDGTHAGIYFLVREPDTIDAACAVGEHGSQILLDPSGDCAALLGLTEPGSIVADRRLRSLCAMRIDDPIAHADRLIDYVAALPRPQLATPAVGTAPILVVPRIFEPELCTALIAHYVAHGGEDSGFMREDAAGRTVGMIDHRFKKRRDCLIDETDLRDAVRDRIHRRLAPELHKAFNFSATRIERYLIACYDSGEGGYFRPHRDNTTRGTAHRRFAVTLNLNAEEYDGGELRFPEYDDRTYRAPTGGAVVFSCSLLHEALPVRRGRRYCVLPFLYDEAAASLRAANADCLLDPVLQDIARKTA